MAVMHHREAGERGRPPVLLLHGYPESSHMWKDVLGPLADAGFHAVAPDLAGYGDTPSDGDGSWEAHVRRLGEFVSEQELERPALVTHDWGGLIGLRWACDNPGSVSAIVVSDTGFFPDGKWHGMADVMRTPGQGEEMIDGMTLAAFEQLLGSVSTGIDAEDATEYFKAFADPDRRRGQLELYRSGDFEKLVPYEGRLAELDVPVLALWGEDDPFAPVAGAYRFQKEVPGTEVVTLPGTGHFVVEDDPEGYARELVAFLQRAL